MTKNLRKIAALLLALIMVLGLVPVTAVAAEYPVITLGEEKSVVLDGVDVKSVVFSFTPDADGLYKFYSVGAEDTLGYILDSSGNLLSQNDDYHGDYKANFCTYYFMTAGTEYLLKATTYDDELACEYTVKVEKGVYSDSISINVGETYTCYQMYNSNLLAYIHPEDSYPGELTWESTDPDVVSIGDNGSIAAKKLGTATVTVKGHGSLSASCDISVLPPVEMALDTVYDVSFDSVDHAIFSFVPDEDGIYSFYTLGAEMGNSGTIYDSDGSFVTCVNGIDTVVQHGLTKGSTYYFMTNSLSQEAGYKVKVTKPVKAESFTLNYTDIEEFVGNKVFLEPVFYENTIVESVISCVSDNESVVSVTEVMELSILSPGSATVTVTTENGLTATCKITVISPIELSRCVSKETTVRSPSNFSYFSFTPSEDGLYLFYSVGDVDTVGRIFDAAGNELASGDDSGEDRNFKAVLDMTAGTKYSLSASVFGVGEPPFSVRVVKIDENENIIHGAESYTVEGEKHSFTCIYCNETYSELHEYNDDNVCVCGDIHSHSIDEYEYDNDEHSGYCSGCNLIIYESHSFGSDNKCVCGYVLHEHTGEELSFDDECHYGDCSICGEYFTESHSYDGDGNCVCGYVLHEHTGEELSFDDECHYGDCSICGEYFTESHSYDGDGNCVCGYVLHEHTGEELSFDDDCHYGDCSICGEYFTESHTYDGDGNCVCGYVLHEHTCEDLYFTHDYHYGDCSICGENFTESHTYDDEGSCVCGYFDHEHSYAELEYDETYHYALCELCAMYVFIEHDYDIDGKCECGYFLHDHSFDSYDYDDAAHWKVCSKCALFDDTTIDSHSPGADGVCDVCLRQFIIDGIFFGAVKLHSGEYLDNSGNVSSEKPSGGYAYYKDGELTLHNFNFTSDPELVSGERGLYSEIALEIILEGQNEINTSDSDGIYLLDDLTVSGGGTLSINVEDTYEGIKSYGGGMTLKSGTININSGDHGIELSDDFKMEDGIININADDDGIDLDGEVQIDGGSITINTEDNGIDAFGDTVINGGNIYIHTNDDNGIESYNVTVNGGFIEIDANDDGICGEISVNINGGKLVLRTRNTDYSVISAWDEINIDPAMGEYSYTENDLGYICLALGGEPAMNIVIPSDTETEKTVIRRDWISLDGDSYITTGGIITPDVSVVDGEGHELGEGTDYKLSFSSDSIVSAGIYHVTVTGIGDYIGVHTITFTVVKGEEWSISGTLSSAANDGEEFTVTILNENGDVIATTASTGEEYTVSAPAGSYTVEVSRKDHVTRSFELTLESVDIPVDVTLHLKGDINGDGKVNTTDVGRANAHAKKTNLLEGYELACADVSGDGKVNTTDVGRMNAHAKKTNLMW